MRKRTVYVRSRSLIFLLEYSECFITDARVCWKFVRIGGVYVHTGIRQLVLTEELFTDGIVNNE